MAMNFGEQESGFHHPEVVCFINNEILSDGGSPDFYKIFSSQPWKEIEDKLRDILVDPHVPHPIKRACTWSALAWSVCVGARQQEQQVSRIQWLQQQAEEFEVAYRAVALQLQQLHLQCVETASQLQCAKAALCQALNEREVLRTQMLHLEMLAQGKLLPQEVVPVPGAQQNLVAALPMHTKEQGKMVTTEAQDVPHLETQMAAPVAGLSMPGPQSPLAQRMQCPLPKTVPHPSPSHASLPVEFPHRTPRRLSAVGEAKAEAAATEAAGAPAFATQMPTPGIYPPGPRAAVWDQGEMAQLCDKRCHGRGEYSESLQGGSLPEDTISQSQEEGPVMFQGKYSLGTSKRRSQEGRREVSQEKYSQGSRKSPSQEEGPVMFQGKYSLGTSKRRSQEGRREVSQEKYSQGSRKSQSQEEGPVMFQGKYSLGNSKRRSQGGGREVPQEKYSLGSRKSHRHGESPLTSQEKHSMEKNSLEKIKSYSQEGGAERFQEIFPQYSKRGTVSKIQKKCQPQGKEAKQPSRRRASESQSQEKFASYNQKNWKCPLCEEFNFPCSNFCYRCKTVYMEDENGDVNPGRPL